MKIKVKIFTTSSHPKTIEDQINEWLETNVVEMTNVVQTQSELTLIVTIFYKEYKKTSSVPNKF